MVRNVLQKNGGRCVRHAPVAEKCAMFSRTHQDTSCPAAVGSSTTTNFFTSPGGHHGVDPKAAEDGRQQREAEEEQRKVTTQEKEGSKEKEACRAAKRKRHLDAQEDAPVAAHPRCLTMTLAQQTSLQRSVPGVSVCVSMASHHGWRG